MARFPVFLLASLVPFSLMGWGSGTGSRDHCQKLESPFCSGQVFYNWTVLPNSLGHDDPHKAHATLRQFQPLVDAACSPFLRLFLCSLYLPVCIGVYKPVPPCRALCHKARNPCKSQIKALDVDWPKHASCGKFPVSGLCVSEEETDLWQWTLASKASDNEEEDQKADGRSDRRSESLDWNQSPFDEGRCEKVSLPMCTIGLPYNETSYPNLIGHDSQEIAWQNMISYELLAARGCSEHLRFFMCVMHAPVCTVLASPMPPCKSLCRAVKSQCKEAMWDLGILWPDAWSCRRFPAAGLCLGEHDNEVDWFWRRRAMATAERQRFALRFRRSTTPKMTTTLSTPTTAAQHEGPLTTTTTNATVDDGGPTEEGMADTTTVPVLTMGSCENVREPTCMAGIPYNWTAFPNAVGHATQAEAGMELRTFAHVLASPRSINLRLFLCSVYIPVCTVFSVPMPPCQSLCQAARQYFQAASDDPWPAKLPCRQFPLFGLCHAEIAVPDEPVSTVAATTTTTTTTTTTAMAPTKPPRPTSAEKLLEDTTPLFPVKSTDPPRVKVTVGQDSGHCQAVTLPLCTQGVAYNETFFPNLLGHRNPTVAALEMRKFEALIQSGCSRNMRLFLCTVFAPLCTILKEAVPPCREFCEQSLTSCLGTIYSLGLSWPDDLRCDRFPREGLLCVRGHEAVTDVPPTASRETTARDTTARSQPGEARSVSSMPAHCQEMTVRQCIQGVAYNLTVFPNVLGHPTQAAAQRELSALEPLIRSGCSPHTRDFLCSVYAPLCTVLETPIPPCKHLCLTVASACSDTLTRLRLTWPPSLECHLFPESGLCIAFAEKKEEEEEEEEDFHSGLGRPVTTTVTSPRPNGNGVTSTIRPPGCQKITVRQCTEGIAYNETVLPNLLNQSTQAAIQHAINAFDPLIESGCSRFLRFFLCTMYVPVCTVLEEAIPPCRSLCDIAYRECTGALTRLLMDWPENFECQRFPKSGLCVGLSEEEEEEYAHSSNVDSGHSGKGEMTTQKATNESESCQSVALDFCRAGVPYTLTQFPNRLGHGSQEEARRALTELAPLVNSPCSDSLRAFVCNLYAPMCILGSEPLPPCRSLCDHAFRACRRPMRRSGVIWPDALKCNNFPESGFCVGKAEGAQVKPSGAEGDGRKVKPLSEQCVQVDHPYCSKNLPYSMARFPNVLNHDHPSQAAQGLEAFQPLVDAKCGAHLSVFLCTVHFPPCTDSHQPISPCRSLCRSVRNSCRRALRVSGIRWPRSLQCRHFPVSGMCIGEVEDVERQKAIWAKQAERRAAVVDGTTTSPSPTGQPLPCQVLQEPICKSLLPYTMTYFPNSLGPESQHEAGIMVKTLTEFGCHRHLKFFLCSSYFPKCTSGANATVLPCRSLCVKVHRDCQNAIAKQGLEWPEELSCSRYPDAHACLRGEEDDAVSAKKGTTLRPSEENTLTDKNNSGSWTTAEDPTTSLPPSQKPETKCEKITIPLCRNLSYTMTSFPNYLRHRKQDDAGLEVHQYFPLVKIQCSQHLRLFLCAVYAPPCDEATNQTRLPCRSLCEKARQGCKTLMDQFGFEWPFAMRCWNFPENDECVQAEEPARQAPGASEAPDRAVSGGRCQNITIPACGQHVPYTMTSYPNALRHRNQFEAGLVVHQFLPLLETQCSRHLRLLLCSVYAPPCSNASTELVLPCRSLCQQVKESCEDSLISLGMSWPSSLQCDNFPPIGTCMGTGESDRLSTSNSGNENGVTSPHAPSFPGQCQPLSLEACVHTLPYNRTFVPNAFNDTNQEMAMARLQALSSWLHSNCSEYLRPLLCAVHAPPCSGDSTAARAPCRSFCLRARRDCRPWGMASGLPWPDALPCEDLPEAGVCLQGDFVEELSPPERCQVDVRDNVVTLNPHHHSCQAIDNVICSHGLPYNATAFPNFQGFFDQDDASRDLSIYSPLIKIGCSAHLKLFLCSAFFPPCTGTGEDLLPCRSLCEEVRRGCEQILVRYGFEWPACLECQLYPDKGPCLDGNTTVEVIPKDVDELNSAPTCRTCQDITAPACKDALPYNSTFFPNAFGHETQVAIETHLQRLAPLVGLGCSQHMNLFLCSVYLPSCDSPASSFTGPCRSLCEKVQNECRPILDVLGFSWPQEFDCHRFPTSGLCVDDVDQIVTPVPGASRNSQRENLNMDNSTDRNLEISVERKIPVYEILQNQSCQHIRVPFCKGELPYDVTAFPNHFGHPTQEKAAAEFHQFYPLITIECSEELRLFLCSSHLPMCDNATQTVIQPCRAICQKARDGCQDIMKSFGFSWPDRLRCERFRESEPCVSPAMLEEETGSEAEGEQKETRLADTNLVRASCRAITVPFCKGHLPYDQTAFPNALGHRSQTEATAELHSFYPMVQEECSKHLRLFLCSALIPPCENATIILPCRSLCVQARNKCRAYMNSYGFVWSPTLECDQFPESDGCLGLPEEALKEIEERRGAGESEEDNGKPEEREREGGGDVAGETSSGVRGQCQSITSSLCRVDLPYNMTSFPNRLAGMPTQTAADVQLSKFHPLLKARCSKQLHLFLCSVFTPKCEPDRKYTPPCRALCRRSRKECRGVMKRFGMRWPAVLNCKRFSDDKPCLR